MMAVDSATVGGMTVDCLPVGPLEVNCYLLADPRAKEAVVIDPGDEGKRILDHARRRGWKITAVLATHGHFDHVGGSAELVRASGAPFLLPRGDARILPFASQDAARFGLKVAAPATPSRLLDEGEILTVGSFQVRVLSTPGHTPGGAAFLAPAGLFSGDLLFAGSVGRTDLQGGDTGALLRSLREKILPLPDATPVYPGHGPATSIGRERRSNPYLAP